MQNKKWKIGHDFMHMGKMEGFLPGQSHPTSKLITVGVVHVATLVSNLPLRQAPTSCAHTRNFTAFRKFVNKIEKTGGRHFYWFRVGYTNWRVKLSRKITSPICHSVVGLERLTVTTYNNFRPRIQNDYRPTEWKTNHVEHTRTREPSYQFKPVRDGARVRPRI